MIRRFLLVLLTAGLAAVPGCGYHTLGSATHLPDHVRVLAVPLFATKTESYHTEVAMTRAVVREFAGRTRLRVLADESGHPDATLRGTILKETVAPLTFNATSQQSSSYLITMVISVTLTAADGTVLYQNPNYVYRQQYQSTTNLAVFFEENPAAIERLSREFARQLVADVLESF